MFSYLQEKFAAALEWAGDMLGRFLTHIVNCYVSGFRGMFKSDATPLERTACFFKTVYGLLMMMFTYVIVGIAIFVVIAMIIPGVFGEIIAITAYIVWYVFCYIMWRNLIEAAFSVPEEKEMPTMSTTDAATA